MNNISYLQSNSERIVSIVQKFNEKGIVYKGYVGFPHFIYDGTSLDIDAIIITNYGVLAILDGLVNKTNSDSVYNKIETILKGIKTLTNKRKLVINLDVYVINDDEENEEDFIFKSEDSLINYYIKQNIYEECKSKNILRLAVNAIEGGLVKIKKPRNITEITNIIAKLEDNICNYDNSQLECLKNFEEKIQVISGLAGSGKTVILCKKISEIILKNNDANICITFSSRSLKNQISGLIKEFLKRNFDNPDFLLSKIRIVNSWGDKTGDGFYSNLCKENNIKPIPLYIAKKFNPSDPFYYCCRDLYNQIAADNYNCSKFDYIFVDEAQDNNEYFLKLCYLCLADNGKLVYAYDEFQDINDHTMKSPEQIFEKNVKAALTPLSVCYRTPKEILVTAHSIGMGINSKDGICQFFSNKKIWETIGYELNEKNDECLISRTSPMDFSELKDFDFIKYLEFDEMNQLQNNLVDLIKGDLDNGLLYDDVMVVDLEEWKTVEDYNIFESCAKGKFKTALSGYINPNVFFEKEKIIYSYVHRAKGNEAYKVYIVNAQLSMKKSLRAIWRNRLFTAMTRSKLQVVLLSLKGEYSEELKSEINTVKENNYDLKFKYPTKDEITNCKKVANQNLKTQEYMESTKDNIIKLRNDPSVDTVQNLTEILKSSLDEEKIKELIESLKTKNE